MEEIVRLQTLINNGTNITENYKSLEILINKEYKKIKELKELLKIDIVETKKADIENVDELVNNFLNKSKLEDNTYGEYSDLLKNINYLIDQTDKEKVKIKKLNKNGRKIKIEKLN